MFDVTLSPVMATGIFVLSCLSGYHYRRVWKNHGPRWRLWASGALAALGFAILAFTPLTSPA